MRSLLVLSTLLIGCPTTAPPRGRPPRQPTRHPVSQPVAAPTGRLLLVGNLPHTAAVRVDGKAVGSLATLQGTGVPLAAGVHRLEVSAPGFRPFRLELKLSAAQTERLTITLEPLARP